MHKKGGKQKTVDRAADINEDENKYGKWNKYLGKKIANTPHLSNQPSVWNK